MAVKFVEPHTLGSLYEKGDIAGFDAKVEDRLVDVLKVAVRYKVGRTDKAAADKAAADKAAADKASADKAAADKAAADKASADKAAADKAAADKAGK